MAPSGLSNDRRLEQAIRAVLSDWTRRFGSTIVDDAQASLEAHLGRLVRDCLDVLVPASGGE